MADNVQTIETIDEPTGSNGYTPRGTMSLTRFAEAMREGRVSEVQTRSDFGYMADLVDRGVTAGYLSEAVPIIYPTIGRRRDTMDLVGAHGGRGRDYFLHAAKEVPTVAEKGEYKPIDAEDDYYEWKTHKFGCQWDISWEAYLRDNRDLGLLMEYPQSWGMSARYTQQKTFTEAYAGNTTFFTDARGNYAEGADTALDEDALDAALLLLQSQTDASGNIIPYAGRVFLVVPPILERTARQLLNATFTLDATQNVQLANLVNNTCELIVDPFLPSVDTTQGSTAWYLFCDPAIRPALRYGFLSGYDQPEIFVKAAEAQALFTGEEDPFAGTWLSDDIEFKLRFTWGVDTADYRGAVMMKGQV